MSYQLKVHYLPLVEHLWAFVLRFRIFFFQFVSKLMHLLANNSRHLWTNIINWHQTFSKIEKWKRNDKKRRTDRLVVGIYCWVYLNGICLKFIWHILMSNCRTVKSFSPFPIRWEKEVLVMGYWLFAPREQMHRIKKPVHEKLTGDFIGVCKSNISYIDIDWTRLATLSKLKAPDVSRIVVFLFVCPRARAMDMIRIHRYTWNAPVHFHCEASSFDWLNQWYLVQYRQFSIGFCVSFVHCWRVLFFLLLFFVCHMCLPLHADRKSFILTICTIWFDIIDIFESRSLSTKRLLR